MATADREAIRAFWHGSPLDPYQVLCLRSFVDRQYTVEIFTYDPGFEVPQGIVLRDANEIWPTDCVWKYQSGFGAGSPALHANLFRYAMLHRLGGWWIDLDVVLLRTAIPQTPFYFARESGGIIAIGTLKGSSGHGLFEACLDECVRVGETAQWGDTGPRMFDRMAKAFDMDALALPYQTTYPIAHNQIGILFDPARAKEVAALCADATFLHLFAAMWRYYQIPTDLPPPKDSYLDCLVSQLGIDFGTDRRIDFGALSKRIAS